MLSRRLQKIMKLKLSKRERFKAFTRFHIQNLRYRFFHLFGKHIYYEDFCGWCMKEKNG